MRYSVNCHINNQREIARFHELDDAEIFLSAKYEGEGWAGKTYGTILDNDTNMIVMEIVGTKKLKLKESN